MAEDPNSGNLYAVWPDVSFIAPNWGPTIDRVQSLPPSLERRMSSAKGQLSGLSVKASISVPSAWTRI